MFLLNGGLFLIYFYTIKIEFMPLETIAITGGVIIILANIYYVFRLMTQRTDNIKHIIEGLHSIKGGDYDVTFLKDDFSELSHLEFHLDALNQSLILKEKEEMTYKCAHNSFLASISHDLRTPLTSQIGYLEILTEKGISQEKREKYIGLCLDKSYQLRDLINTSFEYFYLEGSEVDPTALLRCNSIERMNSIIDNRLEQLKVEGFTYEARYCHKKYAMVYDVRLIERLFDNLFTNVARYGDRSKIVKIDLLIKGNHLVVVIENSICQNVDFYATNSTGIGIMNCKKIVALHQGFYTIERAKSLYRTCIELPIENIK